jgi:hypothetical protein
MAEVRLGSALSLWAVTTALVFGLCSCSSGGQNDSSNGTRGTSTTTTSSSGVHPKWAEGLGAGVVVFGPAKATPGTSSPGAAVQGEVDALNSGNLAGTCPFFEPSFQSECQTTLDTAPAGSAPTIQHFALGYVVVDGNEALVGSTGTFCSSQDTPRCSTNADPAAIFSTAKPFATLWSEALVAANTQSNSYSLAPCLDVDGRWYVDSATGNS